ncbi:MAG TPA: DUF4013 domain-containing protein [Candidatus Dormibacteraeota bacterium]|jgi:hypothetical protein|nr:DUF4013 domain-containing protein [Candidatus Dormibacteraeota bacterium]
MSRQGRDGNWYSDDGQWVWDGQAWQPVPPMFAAYSVAPGALVADVGSGFSLPFRDREWATKVIVQALILLIPIVGAIAGYGWMLEYMDNLAQGRPLLPPAGFHLGRGIQLAVPAIVWSLVASLPCIALFVVFVAWAVNAASSTAGPPPTNLVLAQLAIVATWALPLLLSLLFTFIHPALIVSVWRGGMGGGFQIGRVLRQAFGNPVDSLVAAALMIVAGTIASLGMMLCFVGVYFTSMLAIAFMGGFVAWYAGRVGELQSQP